jgi:hypothetical protein
MSLAFILTVMLAHCSLFEDQPRGVRIGGIQRFLTQWRQRTDAPEGSPSLSATPANKA